MKKTKYYVDMDGVIADWVAQYIKFALLPIDQFSALSRDEREVIKQELFTYDFFNTMPVIPLGMAMLRGLIRSMGDDVCILSATGRVNKQEVMRGKADWVERYFGDTVELLFVDKVEDKPQAMFEGYEHHVLIDDRELALAAWRDAGGVGILFKQPNG